MFKFPHFEYIKYAFVSDMYLECMDFLATGGERLNMYIADQFRKLKGYHHGNRRLKIIGVTSLS